MFQPDFSWVFGLLTMDDITELEEWESAWFKGQTLEVVHIEMERIRAQIKATKRDSGSWY